MSGVIKVGVPLQPDLPRDSLAKDELEELHRLITARQTLLEQARMAEHQMQLLLLVARDRRGLTGEINVDPETGAFLKKEG